MLITTCLCYQTISYIPFFVPFFPLTDSTLRGVERAAKEVLQVDADDYFVFAISDANLQRYGIPAELLVHALQVGLVIVAFRLTFVICSPNFSSFYLMLLVSVISNVMSDSPACF
jgi:hypothetical protein